MPRIQVYLPDDLYRQVKDRGLPASELLQVAVRAVVERAEALENLDEYIAELEAELGSPSPQQTSHAEAIVHAIRTHRNRRAV
jgi:metal-responsive CopG/Arc/MetJ family transcriptional regulator